MFSTMLKKISLLRKILFIMNLVHTH